MPRRCAWTRAAGDGARASAGAEIARPRPAAARPRPKCALRARRLRAVRVAAARGHGAGRGCTLTVHVPILLDSQPRADARRVCNQRTSAVSVKESSSVAAFGSVFADRMGVCPFRDGAWGTPELVPTAPLSLHPAAHVLHYSSTCFEGLKAYRWADGSTRLFRMDMHVRRMVESAHKLYLPVPEPQMLGALIRDVTAAARERTPRPPGALYLRPTLIGTQPNIGAAASPSTEALLYVLASPVGDYFGDGEHATRILMADDLMRTTPEFGMVKSGANYVQALGHVMRAKAKHAVDTVLFAPGGQVQETGASNFLLLDDHEIRTPPLDTSYLHGVTRDCVLKLGAHMGYRVVEQPITVRDVLEWTSGGGEAALSGTAAVLAGVGTIIYQEQERAVRNGAVGPNTRRLRQALTDIQAGYAEDPFGWLETV